MIIAITGLAAEALAETRAISSRLRAAVAVYQKALRNAHFSHCGSDCGA
ncbi:hypothetical protein [Bradyrhizobium sp. WSM1417]|nr:hypothetical protein [Bradyrhizobium sp. WSM1417]